MQLGRNLKRPMGQVWLPIPYLTYAPTNAKSARFLLFPLTNSVSIGLVRSQCWQIQPLLKSTWFVSQVLLLFLPSSLCNRRHGKSSDSTSFVANKEIVRHNGRAAPERSFECASQCVMQVACDGDLHDAMASRLKKPSRRRKRSGDRTGLARQSDSIKFQHPTEAWLSGE